ncbi:MAG TPA: glycosyltransferase family 2 protein [Micavibrio sp.]|nr:glycosyltransferase family 2 protein [Micavibrio sp.]
MITVVVPVLNEEENIPALLKEIAEASRAVPISEIIYVDDGSTDKSVAVLQSLKGDYKALRVVCHSRTSGQSAALWTGIKAAGNDIIVTLDGDGQNNPADIVHLYNLYNLYKRCAADFPKLMVAGERRKRNDVWIKRISSRLANHIRSSLLRDNTRDTGCSLKLFRRKDYLVLPYFDHMHRFLPALMIRDNVRVLHVSVSHRPRTSGVSKYGTLDRLAVGIADLWGVWWLLKRPFAHPETAEDISEAV